MDDSVDQIVRDNVNAEKNSLSDEELAQRLERCRGQMMMSHARAIIWGQQAAPATPNPEKTETQKQAEGVAFNHVRWMESHNETATLLAGEIAKRRQLHESCLERGV